MHWLETATKEQIQDVLQAYRKHLLSELKFHEESFLTDEGIILRLFGINGLGFDFLTHLKEQWPAICLAAVQGWGWNIKNVRDKTPEICWEAVKNEGSALRFVPEELQTEEICLMGLRPVKWDTPAAGFESIKNPSLRKKMKRFLKNKPDERKPNVRRAERKPNI